MKNSKEYQSNESHHTTNDKSGKRALSWFAGTVLILLAVVFVVFMAMNRNPTITGSAVLDQNVGTTSTIAPSVINPVNDNPIFFDTPTSRPNIISTNPINSELNVRNSRFIAVTFDQAMDPNTINANTFTVRKESNGALVSGSITSDSTGRVWRFTPTSSLSANTVYIVTISSAVRDASGDSLATDYIWNFKTKSGSNSGSSGGGGS